MDALNYTNQELEKQLNLLEIHLKQTSHDKDFCEECIRKHVLTIEGLAEEGIGFSEDPEKYKKIAQLTRGMRDENIDSLTVAKKVRQIRKSLSDCSNCKTLSKEEKKNLTKDLNNPKTSSILADENHTHNSSDELNSNPEKMVKFDYKPLIYMNAGQFAAEGIRYVSETYPSTEPGKYDKYVSIGGGIALQLLPMFIKLPAVVKQISMVAGSNLLANGAVKWIREAQAPAVVRARANANAVMAGGVGKPHTYAPTFGGPTFQGKVTAKNIPTQYQRASILGGAQAFESPEHADLIRVD